MLLNRIIVKTFIKIIDRFVIGLNITLFSTYVIIYTAKTFVNFAKLF